MISNIYVKATLVDGKKGELPDKTVAVKVDKEAVKDYLDITSGLVARIVDVLPDTGETGILYLVPKTGSDDNYDEYIWAEKDGVFGWEKVGATTVDLSDYYTKEEINAMIGDVESALHTINNGSES